jgi:acylphosphatase
MSDAQRDVTSAAITVHLRIFGRVQGVGYRVWTVHTARRLGLDGWVRNVSDGSVEAVARGNEAAVNNLAVAAQAGPPGARVTEVRKSVVAEADIQPPIGAGFHHIHTVVK